MKTHETDVKPIVVNLFGGPGAGKSTTCAALFAELKQRGYNCEQITEYAKHKTWEKNNTALLCQPYILGKQFYRQFVCEDQVDVMITDAPLLLSLFYGQQEPECFKEYVLHTFDRYENVNYLIDRGDFPYNPNGRSQTESEALEIHQEIEGLLCENNIAYVTIPRGYNIKQLADEVEYRLK